MNPLEIAGSLLGLVNIALLVRRSVWNFPAAMAMVSCIGIVLFEARLYAEAGLQAFFFAANAWGWVLWSRARTASASTTSNGDPSGIPVGWLGWPARAAWLVGTAAASVAMGLVLARHTDAVLPMADSAVAGMSVTAQILLALRRIENWVLWIVIDVVSIALYVTRGLNFLAVLYGIFLVLSLLGLREWMKSAEGKGHPA